MKTGEQFKTYIWLVNVIVKFKKITLKEINKIWQRTELSRGAKLDRRTFCRHRIVVEDMFGLNIECNKRSYEYYIENKEVLREQTIQKWMLSTLSVNNIISESLSLQGRILLESIPCDEYLELIINAMKKQVRVEVTYLRYANKEPSHSIFEPYAIKLFHRRWYVLGHFHRDATVDKPERDYYAVFSFDRILDISITDIKFCVKEDFNAESYFGECYGVITGDDTPMQRIVIRAFNVLPFYLKDLPLHKSQRVLFTNNQYTDFELRLRPTIDFIQQLLSYGKEVMVLSPESLANEIQKMHLEAYMLYVNNKNNVFP